MTAPSQNNATKTVKVWVKTALLSNEIIIQMLYTESKFYSSFKSENNENSSCECGSDVKVCKFHIYRRANDTYFFHCETAE